MRKVLFCGYRKWSRRRVVRQEMRALPDGTIIVHGDAEGADTHADFEARDRGFEVRSYPAKWRIYGRPAGPIRNQQMLDEEHPDKDGVPIDLVIAFSDDLSKSDGTRDMVNRALNAGIIVWLVNSEGQKQVLEPRQRPQEEADTEPRCAWELLPDD